MNNEAVNPDSMSKEYEDYKDYLMGRIEGITGTLHTVLWDKISAKDMEKIWNALKDIK